ncbi:alpha/beta fold hydrolase [Microbacterium saperdae]|uniref:Pimeloyl-ACP methyl ester carboxylesterase n=1 Tax=Microbacterium saperdae TaxID=69368 RepID=A0A543BN14_9MICO|nr:alpha/beta hydrolase [Microbacterium saperdae]TQL86229.1 pimeloyl-ACP methyl ester carboxylesterase [Microbacterium saperdae]GGM49622.1 alpha/beta hydrolase [Microbacterium saperdae]
MTVAITVAVIVVVGSAGLGGYAWNNTTYASRDLQRVQDAGFREAQAVLPSGTELNFTEGPDNGPAVLLLHGQGAAWASYARTLPELATGFHVYAIDFAGHGDSARTPGRYDVHHLGQDVVDFIREVIGEPVILSGHSSGGLVAAWVAAAAPEQVRGLVFEDPPFFSTDPDRMPQQFNYVDLAEPAHEYLQQDAVDDFASWYIEHNGWIGYFGGGRDGIVSYAKSYRQKHPDQPLSLWFLPPNTNESFAYMHEFDPAFADAFYTLAWQEGFDQAATLEKVLQPSILVHANWRITDAGILEGAMTDDDAARACDRMADCVIERVDTGHGFHFEKPADFAALFHQIHKRTTP